MPNRRKFLKSVSSAPLLGAAASTTADAAVPATPDYFKEFGLRPFINAAGSYTTLTASLMPPEVAAAWNYASKNYVHLIPLHDAVAARIAKVTRAEAAMVTSGAAGALVVGTAACITGKDQDKIRRLPDTTGMKNEVIIQKSHRYGYDHAVRAAGTRFIEIETAEEFSRAVNERTAMTLFFNDADPRGKINAEQWVALSKKHNIPSFNDAAADVPPVENLWKYTQMGFDLVTFSGGKNIRGPQSAGLLLGRKDLIEAARLNSSPYSDTVGRGLKVNKEELLAMMVAIERFVNMDHAAEMKEGHRRVNYIADVVKKACPSAKTRVEMPPIANHVPHLHISWDYSKISVRDVVTALREGEPSIEVTPSSREDLVINPWPTLPGQAEIVGKRVAEILKKAGA